MSGFADYVASPTRLARANPVVRAAALSDVDAVARIQRRAERDIHTESLRHAIESTECCVLVAEVPSKGYSRGTHVPDPEIVGWAQTRYHSSVCDAAPVGHYLAGVTASPDHRRRGIAHALTAARMRWIGTRADEAYYVVNPRNCASIDLHRRWGFEEVLRAESLTGVTFSGGVGLLMRARLGGGFEPALTA